MQKKLIIGSAILTGLLLSRDTKAKCCGIIGIISQKRANIGEQLSLGVQLLKNRGYDSAGIVTFSSQNGVVTDKLIKKAEQPKETMNCIDRLVKQVSETITKSHIGIGHTRWATCGAKVQRNAHPQFDQSKSVFIVHNGIIGGHAAIKRQYLNDVHFQSQTDTEVVAQLIGKFRNQGKTMIQSLKLTQQIMRKTSEKPQWGIVIIDKRQPNKIWTTTNGSPILIGMNEKQIFVASQAIAFHKEADSFFVTTDGQIFELQVSQIPELRKRMQKQQRLKIVSKKQKEGVNVKPPEGYSSFYSYQIRQQGQIEFFPQSQRVKALHFGPFLTMIACGSSMYAALAAQYYFKKLNTFCKVSIYDPAQLLENDIIPNETVVLISQSGQTKDLINVVERCKQITGVSTVGIINIQGSTLARKVDFPIYIKVGRQVSVAATKSMFHQMLNLIMLAIQVAQKKQSAGQDVIEQMKKQLFSIPFHAKQVIQSARQQCSEIAKILQNKQSIYLLAMRETMAIAKEAALKIKQLNYIHAEALGACQMKHGPIALIQSQKPKQTAVILFILDNQTFEQCANAFDQMSSRNALIIIVTDCFEKLKEHFSTKKKSGKQDVEKKTEEFQKSYSILQVTKLKYFSSLLTILPLQILVEQISKLKKINPDMPRNLAKTVTV